MTLRNLFLKLRNLFQGQPEPEHDRWYIAALEFCRAYGYRGNALPPFEAGVARNHCPIALALGQTVFNSVLYGPGGIVVPLPPDVQAFIARADNGLYPELGKPHRA